MNIWCTMCTILEDLGCGWGGKGGKLGCKVGRFSLGLCLWAAAAVCESMNHAESRNLHKYNSVTVR